MFAQSTSGENIYNHEGYYWKKEKITLPDSSISNFDASEEIQSALQGHFK